VGRHRLHLKRDEPLPVGGAHRTLARRQEARRDDLSAKLSELAHAWWDDRVAPDWVPHTREQNQAILERLGLVGEFWQLP
jgi:hypothetical protein